MLYAALFFCGLPPSQPERAVMLSTFLPGCCLEKLPPRPPACVGGGGWAFLAAPQVLKVSGHAVSPEP